MATRTQAKPKIDIATKNYRIMMMTPEIVTNAWVDWVKDPSVMNPLNVQAMSLTKADLQRYVTVSNAQQKAVIGIFRANGGQHIGIYEVALDKQHMNAAIEILVDTRKYDFDRVVTETMSPLVSYLQNRFSIRKFVALVPESYADAINFFGNNGWIAEGMLREELPALGGGPRLAVHQFGLLAA